MATEADVDVESFFFHSTVAKFSQRCKISALCAVVVFRLIVKQLAVLIEMTRRIMLQFAPSHNIINFLF